MRVLLDECLPKRLKREFVGHDVIAELAEVPVRLGQCLLGDVLGIFAVPQDAIGHTEHQRGRVGETSLELPSSVSPTATKPSRIARSSVTTSPS